MVSKKGAENLRKKRGRPRKDESYFGDPTDVGNYPSGMGSTFRSEWESCRKMWPQLTLKDRPGLIQYVSEFITWKKVWKKIDKDGVIDKDGKRSQVFMVYKDLGASLQRFRNEIGATAAHRTKAADVKKPTEKEPEDDRDLFD